MIPRLFLKDTCECFMTWRNAVLVSFTSLVNNVTSLDLLGIGDSMSIFTPSACRAKVSLVRFLIHFVRNSLLPSFSVGKFAANTTRTPCQKKQQHSSDNLRLRVCQEEVTAK